VATEATTIGGIVCGLKVVRLDDRPIDWSIAMCVRLVVFFARGGWIGFIWVAFDPERQSWHDKLQVRRWCISPGTSLL